LVVAECSWCLADLPAGHTSEWCNAGCKSAWHSLFGPKDEDAEPDEDVYADGDGALPLERHA